MITLRLLSELMVAALVISHCSSVASPQQRQWHTRPDEWKEPRNFHTPFEPGYDRYLVITRQPIGKDFGGDRVFSLNKTYWFRSHGGVRYHRFSPQTPILVFNERDYLIRMVPTKEDPDYYLKRIEWISEKLIYIEVWWGHVLGSCFVFDVEKEIMIYREMVNDGTLPFQQWQQKKKKKKIG